MQRIHRFFHRLVVRLRVPPGASCDECYAIDPVTGWPRYLCGGGRCAHRHA